MSSDNTVMENTIPPENTIVEKSFIINDDTFNDDKQAITTDFYTAIIYLHRFERTQMNGGYIKIPYFMPSGTMRPNATYLSDAKTSKYKCANLYIFKASHKITMDATFDAELVIELVPTVNTSEKLYLCFLLTTARYIAREPNGIDYIIDNSKKPPTHYTPMNFELQKLIEQNQKKIIYKSGIDTVIVFLSPITINEVDFSNYDTIPYSLFAIYPVNNDYKIIVPTKIEGFTEGMDVAEITSVLKDNLLTCEPVDDNDQSLVTDNTATYLVDGIKDAASKSAGLGTGLTVLIIALAISVFVSPVFFKYAIADYITKDTSLSLFTVFIAFIFFLLGLILLIGGNKYDPIEAWAGGFFILLVLLSSMSIALSRFSMKPAPDVAMAQFDPTFKASFETFKGFINNVVYERGQTDIIHYKFLGSFLVIYVVLLLILVVIRITVLSKPDVEKNKREAKGYKEHLQGLVFGIGAIYGFIFLLWIMMAFKYSEST